MGQNRILNTVNSRLLMTLSAYAAHRGVGKSAVSNYRAKDWVVMAMGPDGKMLVDVQRTDATLNAKLDPLRGRPSKGGTDAPLFDQGAPAAASSAKAPPPQPTRLGDVRTDLLEQQAIGQRMKNAKEAGQLVPLAEASRKMSEGFRLARERMHSIVRSEVERIAAERDPRVIAALLFENIDRAFGELADQVEAGALEETDEDADADGDDMAAEIEAALAVDDDDAAQLA